MFCVPDKVTRSAEANLSVNYSMQFEDSGATVTAEELQTNTKLELDEVRAEYG